MKKAVSTERISPLAGTERTFFEGRMEALRAGYELHAQGIVDGWESSSETVAALKKKRFGEVHIVTFFGAVALRCREGVDQAGHWRCPALAYLGIRPHQRYSPDLERRMASTLALTSAGEGVAMPRRARSLSTSA